MKNKAKQRPVKISRSNLLLIAACIPFLLLALLTYPFVSAADTIQPRSRNHTMPKNIGIVADSRMYIGEPYKNFGGFVNYIKEDPEKYSLFSNTTLVYEDGNPGTSQFTPGEDLYVSVANNPLLACSNFPRVINNGHDAIIISIGVNSTGYPKTTIQCLDKMVSMAKSNGILVIAFTMAPWKGYQTWTKEYQEGTEMINNWIRNNPDKIDLVVDIYTLLEDPEKPGAMRTKYTGDKLHLMPVAHEAIADEFMRVLKEYIGN